MLFTYCVVWPIIMTLANGARPGLKKISCNRKEISSRAEKQEIICVPDSPETRRAQFHIWCARLIFQPEVRHVIATKFQLG